MSAPAATLPPLPLSMQHLPRDSRGLPIPFIVAVDSTGLPDFRINDIAKVIQCLEKGLCAISGLPLSPSNIWFVGGPSSAYHPIGAYLDPPARKECLVWALQVCPFLATKSGYRMKPVKPKFEVPGYAAIISHEAAEAEAPEYFVLARTSGFLVGGEVVNLHYLPSRPWMEVEHWRAGGFVERHDRAWIKAELEKWDRENPSPLPLSKLHRDLKKGKAANKLPWRN